MEKEAIDNEPSSGKRTTREQIKKLIHEDGDHYNVKIQDPDTGEVRSNTSISRIMQIEDHCVTKDSLWPLELYCGFRSIETDPLIKTAETMFSCMSRVLNGLLKQHPTVGLSDVEKVLRWGDCITHIVAQKPPVVGSVRAEIVNGLGESCPWHYEIFCGFPMVIEKAYRDADCEDSRENMERLEKAGHIFKNYRVFENAVAKKNRRFGTIPST